MLVAAKPNWEEALHRARRALPAFALLLTIALVAGACGSNDENNTSAGGGKSSGSSATTNNINPTDRADVQDGGTLKWAISSMPANYNYNELDGTEFDTASVLNGLMPYVFDFKADATPVLNKDYFDSAELTAKEPKQVVTYKINPKAKWSDGKPISAADFIAQWNALKSEETDFKVAATNGYDQIESVKQGGDEREAVVKFKTNYADWQALFSLLYPASTNSDPKVFNEGWVDKPLITAGPFKIGAIDQTAKTVTIVRDDTWWGDKAKLDSIVFRTIDTAAQADALANGEIDFQDIGPDVDALKRAEGAQGIEIRRAAGPNFRHFDFNGASEVVKDVKVRKAIGLAIDRATIAKALIGPLGFKTTPLQNHIFMTNQAGYKNNAGELATPDIAAAKKLLDEAGWVAPAGGGTRTKAGKPLTVRFVIPSEVTASQQEGELTQGMLKQIGVDLKIDVVPSDDFFDKYVSIGNFDMTTFSWIGTPFPISSSRSIYAEVKGDNVQQNYGRIGNPEIDKLFDQATTELDRAKAVDLANKVDGLIWDEVHSLTLYQRPDIVAAKTNLANYGALGFASVRYQDIGFTKS